MAKGKNNIRGRSGKVDQSAAAPCKAVQGSPSRRTAKSASSAVKGKTPAKNGSQAAGKTPAGVPAGLARILRPGASMRWTLPSMASMTPQYIETVLTGALAGNHVQQWELFDMMLDTWPELGACQSELMEGVLAMKPVFTPWAEEGEAPTESAIERQQVVSSALRRMRPDVAADENNLTGTIRDIADGFLRGTTMLETDWHSVSAGKLGTIIAPRATTWAHPSYFGWSQAGRLGLRMPGGIADLPPHKFLIGIHKAKAGSALGGAMLRPLAWWWCAANFASDWLLNLAQLFGLPFRWANHDPNASQETIDAICNMLQNMGSAGWAAFPAGTTLELKDVGASGDHSPQGDLLDRADRYARMLILGQTMSGSQDSSKGGGKAFGSVEADVKAARTDACAKYVCEAFNSQLITSILELNYGDAAECPQMSLVPDREAGAEEATRDEALARLMPIPLSHLRSKYNVPEAGKGEETTMAHVAPKAAPPAADPKAPIEDDHDPKWEESELGQYNEDGTLRAKLAALADIEDDAIFAKQLQALTDSLK